MAEVCIHDDGDAVLLKTMKDSGVLVKTEERLVKVQGAPDQEAADAGEPAAVREPPEDALHVKDIEVAGLKEPEYGFVRIAL